MRFLSVLALVLGTAPLLTGCASPPETCGEYPERGGPALVRTREQEVCEIARLRVLRALRDRPELTRGRAAELYEHSLQWETVRSVEALLQRVRRDAGEDFAAAVERAVTQVLAESRRPSGPGCEAGSACVARAAAKGARLAMSVAREFVRDAAPADPGTGAGSGAGVR
jgi:hypothetical protein